jgi:hypothetical protein
MIKVMRKIVPPARPLSSILVRAGIKAKHEGKPIPNAMPHQTSRTATPRSPNEGMTAEKSEALTPNNIQKVKKRALETLSAIRGPMRRDTIAEAGSSQKLGRSQAIEKNMVKNQMIELNTRKKMNRKFLLRMISLTFFPIRNLYKPPFIVFMCNRYTRGGRKMTPVRAWW